MIDDPDELAPLQRLIEAFLPEAAERAAFWIASVAAARPYPPLDHLCDAHLRCSALRRRHGTRCRN
jgi:hypothetical protein